MTLHMPQSLYLCPRGFPELPGVSLLVGLTELCMQWELHNSCVFWESEGSENRCMDAAESVRIWVAGSDLDIKREGLSPPRGTGLRAAGITMKTKATHHLQS